MAVALAQAIDIQSTIEQLTYNHNNLKHLYNEFSTLQHHDIIKGLNKHSNIQKYKKQQAQHDILHNSPIQYNVRTFDELDTIIHTLNDQVQQTLLLQQATAAQQQQATQQQTTNIEETPKRQQQPTDVRSSVFIAPSTGKKPTSKQQQQDSASISRRSSSRLSNTNISTRQAPIQQTPIKHNISYDVNTDNNNDDINDEPLAATIQMAGRKSMARFNNNLPIDDDIEQDNNIDNLFNNSIEDVANDHDIDDVNDNNDNVDSNNDDIANQSIQQVNIHVTSPAIQKTPQSSRRTTRNSIKQQQQENTVEQPLFDNTINNSFEIHNAVNYDNNVVDDAYDGSNDYDNKNYDDDDNKENYDDNIAVTQPATKKRKPRSYNSTNKKRRQTLKIINENARLVEDVNNIDESTGQRRSGRTQRAPLQWWTLEHIVYKRGSKAEGHDVIMASPEYIPPNQSPNTGKSKKKNKRRNKQ